MMKMDYKSILIGLVTFLTIIDIRTTSGGKITRSSIDLVDIKLGEFTQISIAQLLVLARQCIPFLSISVK